MFMNAASINVGDTIVSPFIMNAEPFVVATATRLGDGFSFRSSGAGPLTDPDRDLSRGCLYLFDWEGALVL